VNKIQTMLTLQQQLNDATNGTGWENGLTKNGKQIDWRRCIYLEAAELIESYPWKHWKNIDASADYENIKIEAVDIWHFVMSEALRLYKIQSQGAIADLAEALRQQEGYEAFSAGQTPAHTDPYQEIAVVEDFVKALFCDAPVEVLVSKFFAVAACSGLTLDTLPYVSWGTTFADFDLDGWLDLFAVNGHVDNNRHLKGEDAPFAGAHV